MSAMLSRLAEDWAIANQERVLSGHEISHPASGGDDVLHAVRGDYLFHHQHACLGSQGRCQCGLMSSVLVPAEWGTWDQLFRLRPISDHRLNPDRGDASPRDVGWLQAFFNIDAPFHG